MQIWPSLAILLVTGCLAEPAPEPEPASELTSALTVEPRRDLYTIPAGDTIGQLVAHGQLFGIPTGALVHNPDGSVTIPTTAFTVVDETSQALCPTASFFGQVHAGVGGAGVVVGPALLVTASHTLGNPQTLADAIAGCHGRTYLANYQLTSAGEPPAAIVTRPAADVYACTGVTYFSLADDIAIVTLDRAVTGATPLKPRRTSALGASRPALVIGYPHRLPAKLELGAIAAEAGARFAGQAHTWVGNSGGGAIDAESGRLEGIAQVGTTAIVQLPGCVIECSDPALCPTTYQGQVGGPAASSFAAAIPAQGLEVTPDAAAADSYGPPGGPFTNPTIAYTLSAGAAGLSVPFAALPTSLASVSVTATPLAPGETRVASATIKLAATTSLAPGIYDASVRFADQRYATSDRRAHRIFVGTDGFTVTPSATRSTTVVAYALHNRYAVHQTIEVTTAAPWLQVPAPIDLATDLITSISRATGAPTCGTATIRFRSVRAGVTLSEVVRTVIWDTDSSGGHRLHDMAEPPGASVCY